MFSSEVTVFINGVILLANIGILGLSLKIFTEYVKDRAMDRRSPKNQDKDLPVQCNNHRHS